MTPTEINNLAKEIHVLNRKWWPKDINERPKSEILILICSEVIECMEGERKDLMDDKLPHRKMAEVEMADTAIRVLDVMGAFNMPYVENSLEDSWVSNDKTEPNLVKADYLFNIVWVTTNGHSYLRPSTLFSNILYLVQEYCKIYNYDLWGAVREKLEYNKHREDHKLEVRMREGGKKW